MKNLKLTIFPPKHAVSSLVRRVLVTNGTDLKNEILPVGPTGFGYLTYSRFPVQLHYSNRTLELDEQLYLVGQLEKEAPCFTLNGAFFHIGLELFPTVPYYLFGLEGKALTDNGILLRAEAPDVAARLKIRLSSIADPAEVADILQDSLHAMVPKIRRIDFLERTLEWIYQNNGNISVSTLSEKVHVSERHLRREFKRVVGINPKKYCKIIQFNSVFEAIRSGNPEQLHELILSNGYYDQAHFINDFKSYVGQTPQAFIQSGHSFLKNYLGSSQKAL